MTKSNSNQSVTWDASKLDYPFVISSGFAWFVTERRNDNAE